jgi:hypothetical protein
MSPLQSTLDSWRGLTSVNQSSPHTNPYYQQNNTTLNSNNNDNVQQQHQRNLIQQRFSYNTLNQGDAHWGHSLTPKMEGILRLGLRNLNSLPVKRTHSKNEAFTRDIIEGDFDIFCGTETNIAWHNVKGHDRINERFRGQFEIAKHVTSYNKDPEFKEQFQRGGTIISSVGPVCSRIIEQGNDPRSLGRWSWIKLRGAKNMSLVVITVYRPVYATGALSTYQQQKTKLLQDDITECPRAVLLQDLGTQLKDLIKDNNQIIVCGDFNENVQGTKIKQFFQTYNMHELILFQHGTTAPNTYTEGTLPIDGIFGTKGIDTISSGYSSFGWGMYSDHRLLWIDIDMATTLGTKTTPMWKPQARRLKCNDPLIVKRFNKKRKQHMAKHNFYQIQNDIQSMIDLGNPSECWSEKVNLLDELRVKGILLADKKCRRLKMGNVPWSPELQMSMNRIGYYQRCRLRYIMGRKVNSRTLTKWFHKAKIEQQVTTAEASVAKLQEEFKVYNRIKQEAESHRYHFLENLADSLSEGKNERKKTILKQLIEQENQRLTFRKIKALLGRFRQGVTAMEILTDLGWEITINKEEIEQACIKENIKRFSQALSTALMQPSQIELLGWTASSITSQRILEGKLLPEDEDRLHPDIRRMTPYYTTPKRIIDQGPILSTISEEEFTYYWKRSREFTSTGPSGLHFGHFIASCDDSTLCDFDRWFLELSLKTGYSLPRWQKGIDVMIPKKVNNLRAEQLRTIVLMEADFNFLNKLIGRRIMANAEAAQSIAPEQFGSRKKKSSIMHALNKQLTIDILQQDRKNFLHLLH